MIQLGDEGFGVPVTVAAVSDPTDPFGDLPIHACKEQLSIAYVHAVATAARCALESVRVDYETVDATIRQSAEHDRYSHPAFDVQLKCTSQNVARDDHLVWSLDRAHHDSLRDPKRLLPVVLVLLVVPENVSEWIHQDEERLRLTRCAYWMSLRGMPPITTESKTVHLPRANIFDVQQVLGILGRIGRGGHP